MYVDLFRALNEEAVEYVVGGGLALKLHGVQHAAPDIDLLPAPDDANLRRFLGVAARLKLKLSLPIPLEALHNVSELDTWARKRQITALSLQSASPGGMPATVIVRPAVPFERLYRNRVEKDLDGVRLSLASIEDIEALGQARAHPGSSR